jgi:nickel-dependent lactate racemase
MKSIPSTINLAYGTDFFELDTSLPGLEFEVFLPDSPAALPDAKANFNAAIENPLNSLPFLSVARDALSASLVEGRKPKVVIAVADHTRPVPDRLLVPWLAEHLDLPDECITILIGTGTHRGSTPDEINRMFGSAASRFNIVNHNCQSQQDLVFVGNSSCGGECWLNRHWVEADFRIATGFIEPHFYAGFSGGSKALIPGIAGLQTVRHFHRASLIDSPEVTWAKIEGNPLQALTREMAALCPPHFVVNVTLNRDKDITGIFAGELIAVHNAGSRVSLEEATVRVSRRYPIVITTNSGYPLDQNFYQTVKGLSAASRLVEPGGVILVLSKCDNGLPSEGEFANILSDFRTHAELYQFILDTEVTKHDQWQVQTLLQCLAKARIVMYSSLSPGDRSITRTEHTDDPIATLLEIAGASSADRLPVAVLPLGPLTIPVVAE